MNKPAQILLGIKVMAPLTVAMILVAGTAWNDALPYFASGRHLDGYQILYLLLVTALTCLTIGLLWAVVRAWKQLPPSE